ncbi:MAG: phosphoribosyl-AMP cyclohydrolase [Actinobacteria bacterium]|nr:phosphoribosyl-AMP cyclohydrolase [Actinomycetota bacterium]
MATTPELPSELDARLSDPTALIPVIVQEVDSDAVLMLAWMNKAALLATMETGAATYWSRSRSELWVKGATSGNTQQVESIELDCDSDALLMRVKQKGVACHTGARTCFGKRLS